MNVSRPGDIMDPLTASSSPQFKLQVVLGAVVIPSISNDWGSLHTSHQSFGAGQCLSDCMAFGRRIGTLKQVCREQWLVYTRGGRWSWSIDRRIYRGKAGLTLNQH